MNEQSIKTIVMYIEMPLEKSLLAKESPNNRYIITKYLAYNTMTSLSQYKLFSL